MFGHFTKLLCYLFWGKTNYRKGNRNKTQRKRKGGKGAHPTGPPRPNLPFQPSPPAPPCLLAPRRPKQLGGEPSAVDATEGFWSLLFSPRAPRSSPEPPRSSSPLAAPSNPRSRAFPQETETRRSSPSWKLAATELLRPRHDVQDVARRRLRLSTPSIEARGPRARLQLQELAAGRRGRHLRIRRLCCSNGFPELFLVIRVSWSFVPLPPCFFLWPGSSSRRGQQPAAAPRRRRRRFSPPRDPLVAQRDADEHGASSRASGARFGGHFRHPVPRRRARRRRR